MACKFLQICFSEDEVYQIEMSVSEILNIGSAAAGVTAAKGQFNLFITPMYVASKKWANYGGVADPIIVGIPCEKSQQCL